MTDALRLSISHHFLNKANVAARTFFCKRHGHEDTCWAFAAFDNATLSATQIALHLADGRAICVAELKRDPQHPKARRTELYNFASSQLVGIDFDSGPAVAELLTHPFVGAYAFFVYATASSTPDAPRSRALFRLSSPLTELARYREYVARLLRVFELQTVDELQDGVRIFYGSNQTGSELRPALVLPVSVVDALPPTPVPERREKPAAIPIDGDSDRQMLLDALNCIPAETIDYRDWITVLAALQEKFGGEAVTIAEGWSGWCSETGEIADRLKTFRGSTHPAGAGTIIHLAKQYGYQPPRREAPALVSSTRSTVVPPGVLPAQPSTPKAVEWHTSDEGLDRYKTRLTTPQGNRRLPLAFPFSVLAEAGGFCVAVPPGVMIGIVGASGGMKTSFAETLSEKWRMKGANHTLWWGPEWTWEKMADRAVQRAGGANFTDVMLHEMALDEIETGVPAEKRFGRLLPDIERQRALDIADRIRAWPGKSHSISQMDLDIDALLALSGARAAEWAEQGTPFRIAVFDYAQLMDMKSARTESERIGGILGRLKAFCVDQQLIGIVVSQVTKERAANMRETGDTLTAESGQFVRSDKFNLVLTLNPIYSDGLLTDKATLAVEKNSVGRTLKKTVRVDPSRLTWLDQEVRS